MYKSQRLIILLTFAALPACSHYGMPPAEPPTDLYAHGEGFGRNGDPVLVVDLVEFGDSMFRNRPKGGGELTISSETIGWRNADDDDRNFSIRPEVVKNVILECVVKAGGNVCLQIALETVTDLTYRFRDRDWPGGYNANIKRVHDHLARNFPRMIFAEKIVDEID